MAVIRIRAAKTLGLHVCNVITTLCLEKIFLFFPQYDVQVWHVFLWNIDVYKVVGSIALVHGSTFLPSMIYILLTPANKVIQKNK